MFEDVIVKMHVKHIAEDKIATLGQDLEIDWLEWQRQCFETQTSKKTKGTDKEDQESGEDSGKQQEKGKLDNPLTKQEDNPREITPLGPDDLGTNREAPPGFNPNLS